jgi:Cu/Ag efflux pump CusA
MNRIVVLATLAACRGEAWPPPARDAAQTIQVVSEAPGWRSDEVERYITIPLELGLAGMPGLVSVHSTSEPGRARVVAELSRADVYAARSEIMDRLQRIQLPNGIQASLGWMSQHRIALRYLVRGPAMAARAFSDWRIERALRMIPGVIDVDSRGGEVEELHVTLDPAQLGTFGIAPTAIASAIADAYIDVRAMRSQKGPADVGAVVVGEHGGTPIRVNDLAAITTSAAPRTCLVTDARGDDLVEGVVWARDRTHVDKVRAAALQRLAEVALQAPPGITIEPIELAGATAVTVPPGELTDQLPVVRAVAATAGSSGSVVVEACQPLPSEREVPDEMVVMSNAAPGSLADVRGAAVVPGGPQLWVRIAGPEQDELARLADAVVAACAHIPDVAVTARIGTALTPGIVIQPNRPQLARYGINTGEISRTIEMLLGGARIATAYDEDREISIVLGLGTTPSDVAAIRAVPVATPDGTRVPLSELVTIQLTPMPRAILRDEGQRVVAVRLHLGDDDRRKDLRRAIEGLAVPAGYRLAVVAGASPMARPNNP